MPFVEPDWNAPIDLASHLAGIPKNAFIKGVFPGAITDAARRKGVNLPNARARYHPFADIPLSEYLPLLLASAEWMFPELSQRQALRKVGRASFAAVEKSLLLRILLTQLLDFRSNLAVMGRAWSIAAPPTRVELKEFGDHHAVLHFSEAYLFLDSHVLGIVEKIAGASKVHVEIGIALETPYEGDVELRW